jgi:Fic family protein|tara:strand:- start:1026 stop:2177 length:1152 start_codon:yes stop_codon:yes gene_type:complete
VKNQIVGTPELRIVSPAYDSPLTDTLFELNHLRRQSLGGTTAPWLFFQLKKVFHTLESIGSARIEGNGTTVSEYFEQKVQTNPSKSEKYSEIANVESAMEYIEENVFEGTEITHRFIRELHALVVGELTIEGDKTPGAYRTWNVEIKQSEHKPPHAIAMTDLTDELVNFINGNDHPRYDLLKIAIVHHRFTWVHPFGNGNGRVVRLLTYAMMIKFGFNVKDGQLLNPTAVFCIDRNIYYEKLSQADSGTDDSLLGWCDYVLTGILTEVSKINKLLDFSYTSKKVLQPAIQRSLSRQHITTAEAQILTIGINQQSFNAGDLKSISIDLTSRQRTHQLAKLKKAGFIIPVTDGGKTYYVNFLNNVLMRSLIEILEHENFIPPINS